MNNKIDWTRKLTSRKLWLALAGLVGGLVTAFGGSEATATQVTGLIMAAASVVAYIIGEGLVDAAYTEAEQDIPPAEKTKPPEADEDDLK